MGSGSAPVTQETSEDQAAREREERASLPGLCPGACNTLWINMGKGAPRYGEPVLCPRCQSTLRNSLGEIDTLAALLAAADDGHRPSTGADAAVKMHRGGASGKPPATGAEMLDELESCLRAWMVLKRPRAARLGYLARSITETCSWLLFNLPSFSDDPEHAAQFLADIRKWHGRLVRRTKAGTALLSKPLPCPRCGEPALRQERGDIVVKCANCGRHMATAEYDDLAADAAEAAAAAADSPGGKKTRSLA